ncbi:unnamed protein product [Arctogadus glacialis]
MPLYLSLFVCLSVSPSFSLPPCKRISVQLLPLENYTSHPDLVSVQSGVAMLTRVGLTRNSSFSNHSPKHPHPKVYLSQFSCMTMSISPIIDHLLSPCSYLNTCWPLESLPCC